MNIEEFYEKNKDRIIEEFIEDNEDFEKHLKECFEHHKRTRKQD